MTRAELSSLIEAYIRSIPLPEHPERLYAPIAYSLAGGGKRVRPLVVGMACELFGGKAADALPLAAAIEVFHNFTLLHDDIMDNAPTRRGKPAVHARWSTNIAILSGDVMLIEAYKLLAMSSAHLPALLNEFNRMGAEVCEGQQLDIDFEERDEVSLDQYREMIALKTAALIARAAKMGAMVGGAAGQELERMYRFGHQLGLAFQLRDDLLDTYGQMAALGKKVGGDIIEGKKNFLAVTALAMGAADERAELLRLLHDRTTPEGERVERVRTIYDRLGIRRITEERIDTHTALALEALDQIGRPDNELRELALEMVGRNR